jgi:AcrR family transcriptional regulator
MRGRPLQTSIDTLLDAAAEVFLRDGPAATTAGIARHANVSESLLYYHFKSKNQLIAAVIERKMVPSLRLTKLIHEQGSRPLAEGLRAFCAGVLETFRAGTPYVEIARSSPESEAILRSLIRAGVTPQRLADVATAYFEAEAARGRLRAVAPSIAGRVIVATALHRAMAERERSLVELPPLDSDDAFLDGLVDLILRGVAPPPESSPGSLAST